MAPDKAEPNARPTRGPTRRGRLRITLTLASPDALEPNPANPYWGMSPAERRRAQLEALAAALAKLPPSKPKERPRD